MKVLAELAPGDIPAKLVALPDAYARWIREQRDRIADPAEGLGDYRDVAEVALDTCERTRMRIRAGLDLLARDPQAAEAFRFMNRAMWLQRTRSFFAEQRRRGEKADLAAIDVPGNRSWRPFQLAFILTCRALDLPEHRAARFAPRHGRRIVVARIGAPRVGEADVERRTERGVEPGHDGIDLATDNRAMDDRTNNA